MWNSLFGKMIFFFFPTTAALLHTGGTLITLIPRFNANRGRLCSSGATTSQHLQDKQLGRRGEWAGGERTGVIEAPLTSQNNRQVRSSARPAPEPELCLPTQTRRPSVKLPGGRSRSTLAGLSLHRTTPTPPHWHPPPTPGALSHPNQTLL